MRVLLLTSHSIAEYDDLRMLADLGLDVFSIGAYTDPRHPGDDKRPALDLPAHPELAAACVKVRETPGVDTSWMIDPAKAFLHPDVIDWADVIICHHFPEKWLIPQWSRIRSKRVIWRTCGQSSPELERLMAPLRADGLQIVRYSPKEREAFRALGAFAGEDALIRFGKYPEDWYGWRGDVEAIGNVTQDMVGRADACGLRAWLAATEGLPVRPAGPGSEQLRDGIGALSYDAMRDYLRGIRVYFYTGTQPASYTLGLMEAMLTGTPVVSVGPEGMWLPGLFEGHELAFEHRSEQRPKGLTLREVLDDKQLAVVLSHSVQRRALAAFDVATVGPQWAAFLGVKVPVAA